MSHPWIRLIIHVTWATHRRQPAIVAALERHIAAICAAQCQQDRCEALAIGGVDDHTHVLLALHPSASVAAVVQGMKGASSHELGARDAAWPGWQRGYGALTVRHGDAPTVADHVRRQHEHHRTGVLLAALERRGDDGRL